MSLGENIYKLRTGKKLSQEDFAFAMEVSRQSVSKWENDMAVPELEKLIKMAKLFEVSLDELVGNAPPAPPQVPSSAPSAPQIVLSGDLISAVLLILGILCPFLLMYIYMNGFRDNIVVYLVMWCLFPPLVTFTASCCSPRNRMMYRVYMAYNILWGLAEFLCTAPIGWVACLFNFGLLLRWAGQLDDD